LALKIEWKQNFNHEGKGRMKGRDKQGKTERNKELVYKVLYEM